MRKLRVPADNGNVGTAGGQSEPHTAAVRSLRVVKKKRRTRTPSLDAEIRASAKQIYESGMEEAMRAAALIICARKMDEIRSILGAVGINANSMAGMVGGFPANGMVQHPRQQQPPTIEHPCFNCGREGVKRSRPNQWDRAGRWACEAHLPLIAQSEIEDRIDNAVLGPQAGTPKLAKPQIVQTAPATIAPQAMPPQEPAGEASLESAFANLGVPQ